jgi:hypothetical protein
VNGLFPPIGPDGQRPTAQHHPICLAFQTPICSHAKMRIKGAATFGIAKGLDDGGRRI